MVINFFVIFGGIFVITFQYYTTASNAMWNKKDWEFTLATLGKENKYEENLEVHFEKTRIGRALYGISGNFTIKTDLFDEQTDLIVDFLKSGHNDNNFRPLAFKVPKQKFDRFMNSGYKVFMHELQNCSNLPVFEGNFDIKYRGKGSFYHIDNCSFAQDAKLPNHLEPGMYKVVISILREAAIDLKLFFILNITPKHFWA